ncbi:MAG: CRISPR system precrRNA processing endoribonuclease RAMP protein Cas6 [Armatimonadota bacterium]
MDDIKTQKETTELTIEKIKSLAPHEMMNLPFMGFRFKFKPLDDLYLHRFANSTLRSAFGFALKKMCCKRRMADCTDDCDYRMSCGFGLCWQPLKSLPTSNGGEPSKGIIVRFPFKGDVYIKKSEPFEIELVLIGYSISFLPSFRKALLYMALEKGLGSMGRRVKIEPMEVAPLIVNDEGNEVSSIREIFDITYKEATFAFLRTLTPLALEEKGKTIEEIKFHHLVKYSLYIVNRLCATFALSQNQDRYKEFKSFVLEHAEKVNTLWSDFTVVSDIYKRKNRAIKITGTYGNALYCGNITPFVPILKIAEVLQIGKDVSFGLGQIRVDSADSSEIAKNLIN